MIEWKPQTVPTPIAHSNDCLCCEHVLTGSNIAYVNDRNGKLLVACSEHCLDYSTRSFTSETLSDWLSNLRDLEGQGKLRSLAQVRSRRDPEPTSAPLRFDIKTLKISPVPHVRETGLQRRLKAAAAQ